MTPSDVFTQMAARISEDPEKTKAEIDGIYKFVITGDNGGSWIVDCKAVEVRQADEEGECTITVADENFVQIAEGEMDAMQAFMTGLIQVEGDMGLAMKLQQVM